MDVRIRGAFTPLRALDPSKLEAVVDLADAAPGEKRYPLGSEDINVPADVEVIAISPTEIRLVLDAVAEKTVAIEPDLAGQPASGAELGEVTVEPRAARIVGPAKALGRLTALSTQPVALEGRDATFSETTTLALPSGVRVREGQLVTVRVKILRPTPLPEPTLRPSPVRTRKGRP